MLSLALHGKIAITEDVLTAAFFDVLAERHDVALLKAIIQTAHGCGPALVIPDQFEFDVALWPRTDAGQPDVRICLQRGGSRIATLLVEAKLWAPKSGSGEIEEEGRSGDQLARYLLAESASDPNVFLLYLTHHAARPDDDLDESMAHLRMKGRHDLADRLLWTSWRAMERFLATSDVRSYVRVRELLRRVRMFWFDGMQTTMSLTLRSAPSFYRANPITYGWSTAPRQEHAKPWRYHHVEGANDAYAWSRRERALGGSQFYRGENYE